MDAPPLEISGSDAEVVVQRFRGADGLGGADENILKDWQT